MKKIIALLLAAVMLLGLAACGGTETPKGTEAPAGTTAPAGTENTEKEETAFKVGAIYINSKNDTAGYTFAHHSGIVAAMKKLGLNPDTLAGYRPWDCKELDMTE